MELYHTVQYITMHAMKGSNHLTLSNKQLPFCYCVFFSSMARVLRNPKMPSAPLSSARFHRHQR